MAPGTPEPDPKGADISKYKMAANINTLNAGVPSASIDAVRFSTGATSAVHRTPTEVWINILSRTDDHTFFYVIPHVCEYFKTLKSDTIHRRRSILRTRQLAGSSSSSSTEIQWIGLELRLVNRTIGQFALRQEDLEQGEMRRQAMHAASGAPHWAYGRERYVKVSADAGAVGDDGDGTNTESSSEDEETGEEEGQGGQQEQEESG